MPQKYTVPMKYNDNNYVPMLMSPGIIPMIARQLYAVWYKVGRDSSRCSSYSLSYYEPDYYSNSIVGYEQELFQVYPDYYWITSMNQKYGFNVIVNTVNQFDIITFEPTINGYLHPRLSREFNINEYILVTTVLRSALCLNTRYVYVRATRVLDDADVILCLDHETLETAGELEIDTDVIFSNTYSCNGSTFSFLYFEMISETIRSLKMIIYNETFTQTISDMHLELFRKLDGGGYIHQREGYGINGLDLGYGVVMDSDPSIPLSVPNGWVTEIETGDPEWPIDVCENGFSQNLSVIGYEMTSQNGASPVPNISMFGNYHGYTNVSIAGGITYNNCLSNNENIVVCYRGWGNVIKCYDKTTGTEKWSKTLSIEESTCQFADILAHSRTVHRKNGISYYTQVVNNDNFPSYKYINKVTFARLVAMSDSYIVCEMVDCELEHVNLFYHTQQIGYTLGEPENEYPPEDPTEFDVDLNFTANTSQKYYISILDINTGEELHRIDYPDNDYYEIVRDFYTFYELHRNTFKGYPRLDSNSYWNGNNYLFRASVSDDKFVFRGLAINDTLDINIDLLMVMDWGLFSVVSAILVTTVSQHHSTDLYNRLLLGYDIFTGGLVLERDLNIVYPSPEYKFIMLYSPLIINNTLYLCGYYEDPVLGNIQCTYKYNLESGLFIEKDLNLAYWSEIAGNRLWIQSTRKMFRHTAS